MANRIPVKAIYSGTYGSSDVTSLGEFASGDTIDVSYIADGTITAAKLAADTATQAELDTVSTVASAALPKAGGAMTGAITTNSTFDGVDIATRDGVLTSTTTTANAALPKAGGAMSGNITMAGTETVDGRDLSVDGAKLDLIAASANAYVHPTTDGNVHIPSGGSTGQILKYSSAGTAAWGSDDAVAMAIALG